ncbi:MAG: DUF5679 domain-containing protein [Ardenticatenaceae bacterium]|nr:DUF5679 domain-containing protein [Ardenticatenaceae bacterium]
MLKRIIQFVGLTIGLLIGWRLGIMIMEHTAPRRLTRQSATEPARTGLSPASPPPHPQKEPSSLSESASSDGLEGETIAYCVGCREKRQVVNGYEERLANGRLALKGECAVCGRTVVRFLREG